MKRTPGWRWVPLLAILVVAGCGGEEAEVEPAGDPGAMDGLTPEQIRAEAEPMSPAVAESLGIVDTTIHVESPFPAGDTLIQWPDTAAGGAGVP